MHKHSSFVVRSWIVAGLMGVAWTAAGGPGWAEEAEQEARSFSGVSRLAIEDVVVPLQMDCTGAEGTVRISGAAKSMSAVGFEVSDGTLVLKGKTVRPRVSRKLEVRQANGSTVISNESFRVELGNGGSSVMVKSIDFPPLAVACPKGVAVSLAGDAFDVTATGAIGSLGMDSGNGEAAFEQVGRADLNLRGATTLSIARLDAPLSVEMADAAELTVEAGTVPSLTLSARDAAEARIGAVVDGGTVRLRGVGDISLNASEGDVDVEVTGVGSVTFDR